MNVFMRIWNTNDNIPKFSSAGDNTKLNAMNKRSTHSLNPYTDWSMIFLEFDEARIISFNW